MRWTPGCSASGQASSDRARDSRRASESIGSNSKTSKEKQAVVPTSGNQSSNRPRRRFTAEFKAGAVRLVWEEGRKVYTVAQEDWGHVIRC
ncbi:MAG: transposase [Myxococcales bacterium]|nr:transposase [Myxococcales bacterium]